MPGGLSQVGDFAELYGLDNGRLRVTLSLLVSGLLQQAHDLVSDAEGKTPQANFT